MCHCQATVRAGLQAGVTVQAARGKPLVLDGGRDAFRVVAPRTVQWTAFKEDGGANARSVFRGETLEVKDAALRWLDCH